MTALSIKQAFLEQYGKRIDKWEQYLFVYERELARLIKSQHPLRLLEVGVQNGGSLEMWSKVLPEGSSIVGVDIDPAVASLSFDHPAITVHVADATDAVAMNSIIGDTSFDIIIDDGSHRSSDVIRSLTLLTPRLAPGGIYVIEDLHASYFAEWEGGLFIEQSSVAHLKGFIDALHLDFVEDADRQRGLPEHFVSTNTWLHRLTFYDSIAVLERLMDDKDEPYRRIVSGSGTDIDNRTIWAEGWPVALLDNVRFGDEALQKVDAALVAEVDALRREVATLQAALEKNTSQSALGADSAAAVDTLLVSGTNAMRTAEMP